MAAGRWSGRRCRGSPARGGRAVRREPARHFLSGAGSGRAARAAPQEALPPPRAVAVSAPPARGSAPRRRPLRAPARQCEAAPAA